MYNLSTRVNEIIWHCDLDTLSGWQRVLLSACRTIYLISNDLANGQLNLRAMSLVFTTILSFVPLIAVSFSVLKAFGVHNQIEPLLLNLFAPLGDGAAKVAANIIGFVDNIQVGLLGTLGIALLFYSVISLLTKVEEAFNYTWRVSKTRTLAERFSNYLSVLMVGPVLVFAAIGTTASLLNNAVTQSLASIETFGFALGLLTKLIPYVLIILAFTFAYIFVPNQKVRFLPALVGGIVAGILWQSVGWIYAFVITQSSSQTAIYASFAILFFFMIWLYLNWLILLVGSSVAFYKQYPEHVTDKDQTITLNIREQEGIALNVLFMIAKAYYKQQPPLSVDAISKALSVPKAVIEEALVNFERAGVLQQIESAQAAYLPALPLESLTVIDVYAIIRCPSPIAGDNNLTSNNDVAQTLLARIDHSTQQELAHVNIKDLMVE